MPDIMSIITEKLDQLNLVDKFILLLLDAKNSEPIPGPLYLQKEMYLLQNVFPELEAEINYEPYFLGPYSEIVSDEVEQLASSGLVRATAGKIKLTPEGSHIVNIIKKTSDKKVIQKIKEFKELLNDLTEDELLAFIYFTYPSPDELEQESVEYKDLLPKRRMLAVSLYRKDKISAQKAAQLAGCGLEDFLEGLK